MKQKRQIIIIVIYILILAVIIFGNIKSTDKKLDILLKNQGFASKNNSQYYKKQLSSEDINSYYKNIKSKKNSTFSIINYDAQSFQILKTKMHYQNEVSSVYNGTFSYETNKISYTNRFTFATANIIVKGTYLEKQNNFKCEVDFTYDVVTESIKESLCKKAYYETLEFLNDKKSLFSSEINILIDKIIIEKKE